MGVLSSLNLESRGTCRRSYVRVADKFAETDRFGNLRAITHFFGLDDLGILHCVALAASRDDGKPRKKSCSQRHNGGVNPTVTAQMGGTYHVS